MTDITLSRAEGENVGEYTITATQKEGANPNYEVTFNEGTFVIEAKDIAGAKVTLGDALKYTGKEQTQEVAKVVIDGIEVPADSYEVTGNTETEARCTYTCHYSKRRKQFHWYSNMDLCHCTDEARAD